MTKSMGLKFRPQVKQRPRLVRGLVAVKNSPHMGERYKKGRIARWCILDFFSVHEREDV